MGYGPQDAPGPNIPAGTPGANMLRQFKSVPQVLAASNIPVVSTTTGLGTGGGAGMTREDSNGSAGYVNVFLGPGFTQVATVVISFPGAPPTLFWSCNFGTFTVGNVGNVYTLTFSAVTGIARSQPYRISYQPATAT